MSDSDSVSMESNDSQTSQSSQWYHVPPNIPIKILPDVIELLNEHQGAYFILEGGGGCGGMWDMTYKLYLLSDSEVLLYEENDCSCYQYTPGNWTYTDPKMTYTFDLYELERGVYRELPPIPRRLLTTD